MKGNTSFQEKNYTIYIHRNKINGKVYIGQTCVDLEKRWGKDGKGYRQQPFFWSAIQKYGWDNFDHDVLAQGLSETQVDNVEKYWIKFFNSNNSNFGYNLTDGGQKGHHLSLEQIESRRHKANAYWASEQGKLQAERYSKIMSGENNPSFGRPVSQEVKNKISKAKMGKKLRPMTQECKDKIGIANTGIKNGKARPVYCIELQKFFGSIKEASRCTGVNDKAINRCCKGQKNIRNSSLHWRFATPEEVELMR